MITLEPEQRTLLLENKGCEHPLYLSYLCENLRQFGDYSLVTNRLKTYPQTLDGLLDLSINEIYTIVDNPSIVDAFFKLLIISDIGILESDIVTMLQYYINKKTDENNPTDVNQMTWSTLRRYLKAFLDTSWILGFQLIIFRHSSIEKKLRQRCLKEDINEIHSLNVLMADFYRGHHSKIKDFAARRIPYHYEQAHMYKELLTYLRAPESHHVTRFDRQTYLRRHRCTKLIPHTDSILNQRAYLCHICAMQFKLGPFTMAKSSCLICTNFILAGHMVETASMRREARLCQKHGSVGYPHSLQCVVCKIFIPKPRGPAPTITDPIPLNICYDCWVYAGIAPRCCAFELD